MDKKDNNNKRFDLELIRVVSAFGIVWFHSGISYARDVAYSGLICFIVLSAYFASISNRKHKISKRVSRLLIPYLIWSAIYGLFNLIRGVNIFPENYSFINALLASTSIHLWYLPFIFFCILAVDVTKRYYPQNLIGLFSGITALLLIVTASVWRSLNYMPPWGQYIHALPAFLVGVFWGCFGEIRPVFRNVLLFCIYIVLTIMLAKDLSGFSITYLVGLIPCLLLLKKESAIKKSRMIGTLSNASFGVYLVHILPLFLVQHFGITGCMLPSISFIISIVGVIMARKFIPNIIVRYVL